MRANDLPRAETRLIQPRALQRYTEGLGWQKVDGVNGVIAAYWNPRETTRQVVIPLDDRLDDYADATADAVTRLAEFEGRPAREVLDHLLLPPADVLSFRVVSPETEAGDISLEQGGHVIDGARSGLLAVAHSVTSPQAFYPRLRRDDARKFLSRCRMTTGRGSFVLAVSCLLDQTPALPGLEPEPFTRRVTTLFVDTLGALASAAGQSDAAWLTDTAKTPGMSANLCEALLKLRPDGERSRVGLSVAWSRTRLPEGRRPIEEISLSQEVFDLAEVLAARLRTRPKPEVGWYVGFVEELKGEPTLDDPRPSGEVRLILHKEEESIRVTAELPAREHAIAIRAYEGSLLVKLRGELHRLPRANRLEQVSHFRTLTLDTPDDP